MLRASLLRSPNLWCNLRARFYHNTSRLSFCLSTDLVAAEPVSNVSYERKTPVEHVLLRPGMYIGQTEISTVDTWVYDTSTQRMQKKSVSYSPALLKLFDEVIVNAADNHSRDKSMTKIDVNAQVSPQGDLQVSILNDGKGIPIAIHEQEQIYIPELIFGHLLTGSNFNDSDSRLTGGSHGYGAKLTNIFSTMFQVEIYDKKKKQLYQQTWRNNMSESEKPIIEKKARKTDEKGYTKITFTPDMPKFNMRTGSEAENKKLLSDVIDMFMRRAIDVSGCLGGEVAVSFNGNRISVGSFPEYVNLFSESSSVGKPTNNTTSDTSSTTTNASNSSSSGDGGGGGSSKSNKNESIIHSGLFPNKRWEVAVKLAKSGGFANMSFVNSVWTPRGGSHVNAITQQMVKGVEEVLNKKGLYPTSAMIRNRMHVFVNSKIENPSFEGQTKELLISKPSNFGSVCTLPATYIKRIVKQSGIVESITRDMSLNALHESNRLLDGISKSSNKKIISEIPKLEDAHLAGSTRHSLDCTLILTEGDSAKALAVAGLEVVGREKFGILPLKGKVLNVRNATRSQMAGNVELANIVKTLGLDFSKSYEKGLENEGLRYGKVLIMCDQDTDGSHIKGLIINFFHHCWPHLVTTEGFLQQFVTPVLKVQVPKLSTSSSKAAANRQSLKTASVAQKVKAGGSADPSAMSPKHEVLSFYSIQEYAEWMVAMAAPAAATKTQRLANGANNEYHISKAKVKYYKGLGTSTSAEGRAYFSDLEKHRKCFVNHSGGEVSMRSVAHGAQQQEQHLQQQQQHLKLDDIDMIFNRSRALERREWLTNNYREDSYVDLTQPNVTYDEFLNKELIHYSFASNIRSIPSSIDGLKPSQRKVLYGCLKKLRSGQEMKVVQIAGYIAEQTAYHHGDASLHATIINMAQDYTGANNVPLLEPVGQFGTRAGGGSDSASPRYIFTRVAPITRALFPLADDALLDYQQEDGTTVEPRYFIPIIPSLLVNGSTGIGTGWSTTIPCYNLLDVVDHVEYLIHERDPALTVPRALKKRVESGLAPWYRGFSGEIVPQRSKESAVVAESSKAVSKLKLSNKRGNSKKTRELPVISAAEAAWFLNKGRAERTSAHSVEISELPVGNWTDDYKLVLCKLVENGEIKSFTEHHSAENVRFVINASKAALDSFEERGMSQVLKLESAIKIDNMHAFNKEGVLVKFNRPEDIIHEHFGVRWDAYVKRKEALERNLAADELIARNKSKFIKDILSGEIQLLGKTGVTAAAKKKKRDTPEIRTTTTTTSIRETDMVEQLKARRYASLLDIEQVRYGPTTKYRSEGDSDPAAAAAAAAVTSSTTTTTVTVSPQHLLSSANNDDDDGNNSSTTVVAASQRATSVRDHYYSYLLDMPIHSLTEEKRAALDDAAHTASLSLDSMRQKTVSDLWLADLEHLRKAYKSFLKHA